MAHSGGNTASVVYFVDIYVVISIQYKEIFSEYEWQAWFENRAYTGE